MHVANTYRYVAIHQGFSVIAMSTLIKAPSLACMKNTDEGACPETNTA